MKGVSIAIETIIYIIVAVMVMTILIYFFTSQSGPVQSEFQLRQQQVDLCRKYVAADPQCSGNDGSPISSENARQIVQQLGQVCSKLPDVRGCTGTATLECIQYCCIICPTRPSR